MPVEVEIIAQHIYHLWTSGMKTATIRSHLAAISFFHNIGKVHDPCKSPYIKQIVKGMERTCSIQSPSMLPINIHMLHELIHVLPRVIHDKYDYIMYKAIFIFSYYFCLRAGEAVISNTDKHTIRINQLTIQNEAPNTKVTVHFKSYKHCVNPNSSFSLSAAPNAVICPVQIIKDYLKFRPNCTDYLFLHRDGKPVYRTCYSRILKACVSYIGKDVARYNTHSIRIGRATDLAMAGTPVHLIKETGRWKSDAYLKYIRINHYHLPNAN